MNQTIETIINRRSTRIFTEEKVEEEVLKEIVEAGLYAPSSMNKQPWHFTVIQKESLLEELNNDTKNAVKKYAEEKISNPKMLSALMAKANNDTYNMFYKAPVAILISKDTTSIASEDGCAAASQNMMIAAESLGLGSCWVSFPKCLFELDEAKGKEYCEKFQIPENYIPTHAIVIGHKKKEHSKAQTRRENTVTYIVE